MQKLLEVIIEVKISVGFDWLQKITAFTGQGILATDLAQRLQTVERSNQFTPDAQESAVPHGDQRLCIGRIRCTLHVGLIDHG